MIIYVIIAFVAILIGMAISVSAFGTGGKRKKIFQDIYFSVEDVDGIGVLYTKTGEYSAILKMENPVQKYSANIDSYYEFNHLVTALAQTSVKAMPFISRMSSCVSSSRMRVTTTMSSCQSLTSSISMDVPIPTVRLI